MPQIAQITQDSWYLLSQIFWLVIIFAAIYGGIGRGMLPKVEATIEQRAQKIADDLANAKAAQEKAHALEEQYRLKNTANRTAAQQLLANAKQKSAQTNAQHIANVDQRLAAKLASVENAIGAAKTAAMEGIAANATDIARDIVAHLSGADVSTKHMTSVVQTQLDHHKATESYR